MSSVSWISLTRLAAAGGVCAVASGFGLWWRWRQGRPQPVAADPRPAGGDAPADAGRDRAAVLTALGVPPGAPVTLLQFSSAFCAPCRATRVICDRLAAELDGVRHVEVDAESHLDAVRTLGVWRTPTVFLVDSAGRPVTRLTGQPTQRQLVEALTPLLPRS